MNIRRLPVRALEISFRAVGFGVGRRPEPKAEVNVVQHLEEARTSRSS
jgi:hypothetical protein